MRPVWRNSCLAGAVQAIDYTRQPEKPAPNPGEVLPWYPYQLLDIVFVVVFSSRDAVNLVVDLSGGLVNVVL